MKLEKVTPFAIAMLPFLFASFLFSGCTLYEKVLTDFAKDIGIHPYILTTIVTLIIGVIVGLISYAIKKEKQKEKLNKALGNIDIECTHCKNKITVNEKEINEGSFKCPLCNNYSTFDNTNLKQFLKSIKYKCQYCGFEVVLDQKDLYIDHFKCPNCTRKNNIIHEDDLKVKEWNTDNENDKDRIQIKEVINKKVNSEIIEKDTDGATIKIKEGLTTFKTENSQNNDLKVSSKLRKIKFFNKKLFIKIITYLFLVAIIIFLSIIIYNSFFLDKVIKPELRQEETKETYAPKNIGYGDLKLTIKWESGYIYYNFFISGKYYDITKKTSSEEDYYVNMVLVDKDNFALETIKINKNSLVNNSTNKEFYYKGNGKMMEDVYKRITRVQYNSNFLFNK